MIVIVLAAGFLSSSFSRAQCTNESGEFYLTFQSNNQDASAALRLMITTSQRNCSVKVEGNGMASQTVAVTPGAATIVTIPSNRSLLSSGIDEANTALYVHSLDSTRISVAALSKISSSADAFLALPTNALGINYLVAAYGQTGTNSAGSQVAVVATQDGTSVTFTPPTGSTSLPTTVTLNRLHSYQLQITSAVGGDYSGWKVTSDKPIATFAGHYCATITTNNTSNDCDVLLEELLPAPALGSLHFIVPFVGRETTSDIIRVVADQPGTDVYINNVLTTTLAAGGVYQSSASIPGPLEVYTSKPAAVAQYAESMPILDTRGGPLEMIVPPTIVYRDKFSFVVPTSPDNFSVNEVTIIVPTANKSLVKLDGSVLAGGSFSNFTPYKSSIAYSYTTVAIASGAHTVQYTTTPSGPEYSLMAYVYGWSSAVSYGYPAGVASPAVQRIASAASVLFDTVVCTDDGPKFKTIKIYNTCENFLRVDSISIVGANPADFSVSSHPSYPFLAPNGIPTDISLSFAPKATGLRQAVLRIFSNDRAKPQLDIPLNGYRKNIIITFSSATLDFDTIVACSGTVTKTINLTNSGGSAYTITDTTFSGQYFRIMSPALPKTLQPGAMVTCSIRFAPPSSPTGDFSASVSIRGTPCNFSNLLTLTGHTKAVHFSLDNSIIDIGLKPYCFVPFDTFIVVRNTSAVAGTIDEMVSSPSITLLRPRLPHTVTAGSADTFFIRIDPTTFGTLNETVSFSGNCLVSDELTIAGNVYGPTFALTPDTVDFGTVTVNSPVTRTVVFTNSTPATVRLLKPIFIPAFPAEIITEFPARVAPNATFSITIIARPEESRNYFSRLCMVMDSVCQDTFCRFAMLSARPSGLAVTPDSVFFDKYICEQDSVCFSLTDTTSDPVTINSYSIQPSQGFIISSGPAQPFTINPDSTTSICIHFNPTFAPGSTERASLVINTNNGIQLLPLTAVIRRQDVRVSMPSLDLGIFKVSAGIKKDSTLIVINRDSKSFVIDSMYLDPPPQNGDLVITTTTMNLAPGGGKDSVMFSLLPSGTIGYTYAGFLRIHSSYYCDATLSLPVSYRVTIGNLAVSPSNVNHGYYSCPLCDTIPISIIGTGSDSVLVKNILLDSAALAQGYHFLDTPQLPLKLAPNQVKTFRLEFCPGVSAIFDSASVLVFDQDSVQIPPAVLKPERRMISLFSSDSIHHFDTVTVNFPNRSQRMTLKNTSRDTITVSDFIFATTPSPFSVVNLSRPLPTRLAPAPYDSLTFQLQYSPIDSTSDTNTLQVVLTTPCDTIAGITRVDGRGDLRIRRIEACPTVFASGSSTTINGMMRVNISFHDSMFVNPSEKIVAFLSYDPEISLVTSIAQSPTNTCKIVSTKIDPASKTITVTLTTSQLFIRAGEVFSIQFQNLLSTHVDGVVNVNSVDIPGSTTPVYSNFCGLRFTLDNSCVSPSTLRSRAVSLAAIYPNPFSHEAHASITVNETAVLEVSVFDMVGKRMMIAVPMQEYVPGTYTLPLMNDAAPNATYIVSVRGVVGKEKIFLSRLVTKFR